MTDQKFRKMTVNREVNMNHVEELKRVILKNGYNPLFPILITHDGLVIDGQHRLQACLELGIKPVVATIDKKVTMEQLFDMVRDINTSQRKWTLGDYIHYWASRPTDKKEMYATVLRLSQKYNMPLNCVISVTMDKGIGGNELNKIKNGEFNIGLTQADIGLYNAKLREINELVDALKLRKADRLVRAITKLYRTEGFDIEVMKRKIDLLRDRVQHRTTIDGYLLMLVDIYNYKNKDRIGV